MDLKLHKIEEEEADGGRNEYQNGKDWCKKG